MFEHKPDENAAIGQSPDVMSDQIEIIGISFRTAGKIYYFAAGDIKAREGEHAIVETARGQEFGMVALSNRMMPKNELVLPLRKVVRLANKEDEARYEANRQKEEEAFHICQQKIDEHKLDMKLIDVEYTFDNTKLLFYFTSDDRVDFRELVKDLAAVFRTRIELRQIGIRDEAKLIGGIGVCGRVFCCHSFLGDFAQVTIKMAKEQNLSLNAAKISGACGKLMCCLRYEHEAYQEEIRLTPKVDAVVMTPDGPGVVAETKPLQGLVRVKLDGDDAENSRVYHRDDLSPYVRGEGEPKKPERRPERNDRNERNERSERADRSTRNEHRSNEKSAVTPPTRRPDKKGDRSADRSNERTNDRSKERQERPERQEKRQGRPAPQQEKKQGRPSGQQERRPNRPMEKHSDRRQEKKPQKNTKND